jgi:hypothetical protein
VKSYSKVAVAFASSLVRGDFDAAHALLAPELWTMFSPEALSERLHQMYSGYADGEPTGITFDEAFTMEDFAGKRPGDVGWAYVSIHGADWTEAVAVAVGKIGEQLLVTGIEWGRP